VIFGVLRHQGGKIAEENRFRSPVSGSVCLSLTRGAVTSTAPALVSDLEPTVLGQQFAVHRTSDFRIPSYGGCTG
jgi:hypothetical protein